MRNWLAKRRWRKNMVMPDYETMRTVSKLARLVRKTWTASCWVDSWINDESGNCTIKWTYFLT